VVSSKRKYSLFWNIC